MMKELHLYYQNLKYETEFISTYDLLKEQAGTTWMTIQCKLSSSVPVCWMSKNTVGKIGLKRFKRDIIVKDLSNRIF